VKTQIWIAVSIYVLVAILRKRLGLEASLYQPLQILGVTLFEKTPFCRHFRHSTWKDTPVCRVGGSDSRMACVHRIGIAGACFGPDCFCTHSGENRAISDQRGEQLPGKDQNDFG